MRYFYIERSEAAKPAPVITGSDARHIKNVLRLKPGDNIGLFDGKGFDYEARIVNLSPGSVEIFVVGRFPSKTESPVQITVAQAYLKDRKMLMVKISNNYKLFLSSKLMRLQNNFIKN